MLLAFLLLGCVPAPTRSDSAEPAGDSSPPDDTAPPDTDPAVPLDCSSIIGSGSIAIASRADPGTLLTVAPPLSGEQAATSLAGPDSLGRYYLVEPTGIVRRSNDGGCSWNAVGTLPGYSATGSDTAGNPDYAVFDLFTAPTANGVYAYGPSQLLVSEDGAHWDELTAPVLRSPALLGIDPADPDRLRGYGPDGIVTSTDGGASWTTTSVPDADAWYNAAIDGADIDRVALSARGLWVASDGVTWVQRDPELQAALAWDSGVLYSMCRDPDDARLRIRRSTDAGVSFVDLPVDTDPYASVSRLAADRDLVVSGGYRYVSSEDVTGLIQFTTDAGTIVHPVDGFNGVKGVAFGADRVLIAFEGPDIWQND